jgi:hypothetical protein
MSHLREVSSGSRPTIAAAMWAAADHQPSWCEFDSDRLALLTERLGDVAAAYSRGHANVEDEILKLLGTAAAWMEHLESARAA